MTRQDRIEAAARNYLALRDAWYSGNRAAKNITHAEVRDAENVLRAALTEPKEG